MKAKGQREPSRRVKEILKKDLGGTASTMIPLTEAPGWDNVPVPDLHSKYKPGISAAAAASFLELDSDTGVCSIPKLAVLLRYCRLRFTNGTEEIYTVRGGFRANDLIPGCAIEVFGRPFEVTLTSPRWPDELQSPLTLVKASGDKVQLVLRFDDKQVPIGEPSSFAPACPPLDQLAYQRDDGSFTVNPLQVCASACGFCSRSFEQLFALPAEDRSKITSGLVQLGPEVMAKHLVDKFPSADWTQVPNVAIVTGSFRNYEHLKDFTANFASHLKICTNNAFDPIANEQQSIRVFTHLVTKEKQFREMKEVGARSIVMTVEMCDEQVRATTMPVVGKGARSKGLASESKLASSIQAGVSVLGADGFAVAYILGLEDPEVTYRGLKGFQDAGLKTLSALVFKPATHGTIAGFRVSLPELWDLSQRAGEMFTPLTSRPPLPVGQGVSSGSIELVMPVGS